MRPYPDLRWLEGTAPSPPSGGGLGWGGALQLPRIAEVIDREGPITFCRLMELALYDPVDGYYTRPGAGPGPDGDYLTSPELHPAFGGLICAQVEQLWRRLGEPDPFWLIEGGPGTGIFAMDALRAAVALFPRFNAALRVAMVEVSPALRARQRERLAPWHERVRWIDESPDRWEPLGAGCIFANEVLDALPVHRVVMRAEGLRERYVAVRDGRLEEVDGEVSSPAVGQQIADGGGALGVDQMAEVSLAAPAWLPSVARLLNRGYVLAMDYGEPAGTLYGPRHPRGTLRCYWRHTMNVDPLSRPGEQDITAHVDLSAVVRAAAGAGLDLEAATSQDRFLDRLGLPLVVARLGELGLGRAEEWAHACALAALVEPEGLGRIAVLLFRKDAPGGPVSGFSRETPCHSWGERVGAWAFSDPAPRVRRVSALLAASPRRADQLPR